MVPEAPLGPTEHGLVPAGDGWFVLNARETRWWDREGRGVAGDFDGEPEFPFPQLGIAVGAGDEPCVVVAVGARDRTRGRDWGGYTVDEGALRHGAGVEEETDDLKQAYARFRPSEPTRYREGWLPDLG